MGTRADFYVGTGKTAVWIGSLAWDGYRIDQMTHNDSFKSLDNMECWAIKSAVTEAAFRQAVAKLLAMNEDGTTPDQGWPWPWDDSGNTDYAYAFVDGACKVFPWGCEKMINDDGEEDCGPQLEWPNMRDKKNVTFGKRSGTITIVA